MSGTDVPNPPFSEKLIIAIARCNGNHNPSTRRTNDDDQDVPWKSFIYRRLNRPIKFRLEEKSPPRPLNSLLIYRKMA